MSHPLSGRVAAHSARTVFARGALLPAGSFRQALLMQGHPGDWREPPRCLCRVYCVAGNKCLGARCQRRAHVQPIFDPFGNPVHTALQFYILGEDVLITGAGPIGSMAAAVARHAGARYVVITERYSVWAQKFLVGSG